MDKTGACEVAPGGSSRGAVFTWDGGRCHKEERRMQIFMLLCFVFVKDQFFHQNSLAQDKSKDQVFHLTNEKNNRRTNWKSQGRSFDKQIYCDSVNRKIHLTLWFYKPLLRKKKYF